MVTESGSVTGQFRSWHHGVPGVLASDHAG